MKHKKGLKMQSKKVGIISCMHLLKISFFHVAKFPLWNNNGVQLIVYKIIG